jgi:hypothetical protein
VNTSYDVKFWDIRRNASSKTPSYVTRWKVGPKEKSKTFRTKALAENFCPTCGRRPSGARLST